MLDFKSDLLGLIAYCNELTNQIDSKGLAPCFHPAFDLEVYRLKVDQVYAGMQGVESTVNAFAGGLSK